MNRNIYATGRDKCSISRLWRPRRDSKQFSPVVSFISKHSACDMAHYKVVTNKEHQPFKTAAKGVENLVFFLQQSAGRPPPYRFPPPGHPGGIEADFSRK